MILETLEQLGESMRQEIEAELQKRLAIPLEDEISRLVVKPLNHEHFDLLLVCKRCNYTVLVATLPVTPTGWKELIAARTFLVLSRFKEHRCDSDLARVRSI